MAENDSIFNNCVFVLMLYVLISDSSAALKDENTLTIDVSAESSIGSSQKWNTYSPGTILLSACKPIKIICESFLLYRLLVGKINKINLFVHVCCDLR